MEQGSSKPKTKLDFKRPIATRCDYPVRFYDIFVDRYINGAYYDRDTDIWYSRQWDWDGTDALGERNLDLRNVS